MKIIYIVGFILVPLIYALPSVAQILPFQLDQIEILEGPFKNAEQRNKEYLLALDADRLLAPYYKNAGLQPKAENYGNWENTGLDGHTGGHYVSALAMMYAATGDKQIKERFDYVLQELDKCQKASGNGLLTGVLNGKQIFEEIGQGQIKATSFGLNGAWVPLYNQHKLFAGLKDGYSIGGSELSKELFIRLSEWFYELTKNLTDDQIQEILQAEHGGMNEVLLDAYTITGEQKYLKLAYSFSHKALLEPLIEKENKLTGLHANTQIPKVVGFAKIGIQDQNSNYLEASKYFWKEVINHRTVAIGGNSVREHFHSENDFSSMISSEQGPENCNTYNMLRLSKELYFNSPEPGYLNYYERALYNNILSSIHPEKGGFVYFNPMRPNHYRVYSAMQKDFWCCVGSGIENHGKYGEMIYAHNGADIYVNLFIPSVLKAGNEDILMQRTDFPFAETTIFEMVKAGKYKLYLRKPDWLKHEKAIIKINDEPISLKLDSSGFYGLERFWKKGDIVTYKMPFEVKLEKLPDGSDWGAFVAGPIVLATAFEPLLTDRFFGDGSRMGHVADGQLIPLYSSATVLDDKGDYASHVSLKNSEILEYELNGLSTGESLTLKPFMNIHEKRYQLYFKLSNQKNFEENQHKQKAEEEKLLALESITADRVTPGEQQPESDHFFKDTGSYRGLGQNSYYRSTWSSISYELNARSKVKRLLIKMNDFISNRAMAIYINGELSEELKFDENEPENAHEISITLEESLQNAGKYLIEIRAIDSKHSPAITDIRLLYN